MFAMQRMSKTILVGMAAIALLTFNAHAGSELKFEHVMDIGSEGSGEGQFNYIEDFDLTIDGQYIMATDAAHAWVQVFNKTTGEYVTRFGGRGNDDQNLEKPEGISTAPDGRIFIADYTTGEIKIYDKNYKWLKTFSEYGTRPGQNIRSEFTSIRDGLYFMPEAGNHRISVWDLQGNFKYSFGKKGNMPGELNNPEAAKFNSSGHMYVADLKNDRIQVFTARGEWLMGWGTTGSGPGEFSAPAGIGIDRDDKVYVSEIGNNRIQVFDKNGKFLTSWGTGGSGPGQFGNIHGIYVDRATGWVYIADTANNRIQVYKPSGGTSS